MRYKRSNRLDIHGYIIEEGHIINADGYNSDLDKHIYHCVVYNNGTFGSDIYKDFEPLSNYDKIEIVGHVKNLCDVYSSGEWEGNLGEVIKCDKKIDIFDYEKKFINSFSTNFASDNEHILYLTTALGEEVGEILGEVKKGVRESGKISDERKSNIIEEMGDFLYYFINLQHKLQIDMKDVINSELLKLQRKGYKI